MTTLFDSIFSVSFITDRAIGCLASDADGPLKKVCRRRRCCRRYKRPGADYEIVASLSFGLSCCAFAVAHRYRCDIRICLCVYDSFLSYWWPKRLSQH